MDLFIHYAMAAAKMALADSGLKIDAGNAERVGVDIGSGIGGLHFIERQHTEADREGARRVSPFFDPGVIVNMAAGQVAIRNGAKGRTRPPARPARPAAHAIGDAFALIRAATPT